jgi:hypothetical protein
VTLTDHAHLMPLLRPGGGSSSADRPPAQAAPPGAQLVYFGGKVIQSPKVVQVLYGAGTYLRQLTSTGSLTMPGAYSQLVSSGVLDWLKEYYTPSPGQMIGRGSYLGSLQIAPAASHNGSTITDASIQTELAAQISAGALPAPTDNHVYMVNFPSGKTINIDGALSCTEFCAYHSTFKIGSQNVYYSVLPALTGGCATGCGGGNDPFQNQQSVASHELVSAITDPEIGLATTFGPPLGWYDPTNGEIGDICNGQLGTFTGTDGASYAIQNEFSNQQQACITTRSDGTLAPISQLPFVETSASTQVLGELLPARTALGETTALHVRLPPPRNPALANSLVRIVGPADSPQLLFRSDALAQLGIIARSLGTDFFTAFATLDPAQLTALVEKRNQIAAGTFGPTTTESVIFSGAAAQARTVNATIDPSLFKPGGGAVPIDHCSVQPVSSWQAWDQALFIRDPKVVLDPARTWDPCTGAGTKGGVWTFAHLIREMATGSGKTAEDFVKDWLSLWLNNQVINSDTVPARTAMFTQVIAPWAVASGATATLVTDSSGHRSVNLVGSLNLDIAPFRLVAIVNRIDLASTAIGGGGYSGTLTSAPVTAGELRFLFDVVQPNPWGAGSEATCGRKYFTTIFEYGVPSSGCSSVVSWAQQWTSLLASPGFTSSYLAQLQSMTESVVQHGAAPTKGNQSALDQIRTNEIALAAPWELREFTLTDENPTAPPSGTDIPSNGELRKHSVAQTPNDAAFAAAGPDAAINSFVQSVVVPGVKLPVSNPLHCEASYTVPYQFGRLWFRGGNALVGPPFWAASYVTSGSPDVDVCARHQFSLNTCGGCHFGETSTHFTHFEPLSSIPVTLSGFLTGGSPGNTFIVADPQLGAPSWQFAALQDRLQRLVDLSHCTSCVNITPSGPSILNQMQALGPCPIDPGPEASFPFRVGPITDLGAFQSILNLRPSFAGTSHSEPASFLRTINATAN